MRIIPAIDLIGGKCVRLTQGNYQTEIVYNEHPLEVARAFEDAGLQYLHLVDLDGAKSGRVVHYNILEQLASKTSLHIDFGGGLRSDEDLRIAFESGAQQVNIGSIAAQQPTTFLAWLTRYGPERIILSADAQEHKIATNGWTQGTSHKVVDFIHDYAARGVVYVACTDVSKDGTLEGPALELYRDILAKTRVKLIASGGIACLNHLEQLRDAGCEGAIIGKAIYEGRITLKDLARLC